MEKFLEVTSVIKMIHEATNREFMRAVFCPIKFVGDRAIKTNRNSGSILFNVGKEPQVGDIYEGGLHTFETTDYEIDGRVVNSITVVGLADENPLEIANKQLERNSACVIMNGKPTVDLKKLVKAPILADDVTA